MGRKKSCIKLTKRVDDWTDAVLIFPLAYICWFCSDQTLSAVPSLDNTALSWIHADLLQQALILPLLNAALCDSLLSLRLSWWSALSPFHSDAQWWRSCHVQPVVDQAELSFSLQFPTIHPGERESAVHTRKWNSSSIRSLWEHTHTKKSRHKKEMCVSLSFYSLCSLMVYIFLVNSSDNHSGFDLS